MWILIVLQSVAWACGHMSRCINYLAFQGFLSKLRRRRNLSHLNNHKLNNINKY